jgi:hypothetical protein
MAGRQDKKHRPTLGERMTYAVIGFLSAGLLSLLIIDPFSLSCLRDGRHFADGYWFLLLASPPLIIGAGAAIWGFIATDGMIETLSGWWEEVMDKFSRR